MRRSGDPATPRRPILRIGLTRAPIDLG